MKLFWKQFELVFTAVGAALVVCVTIFLTPPGVSHWKIAAILALVIGGFHTVVFWVLHQRQRSVRSHTIAELQMMLNDIINNQLTVIQTAARLNGDDSEQARAALAAISQSVATITEALQHISDDSIREWHSKYAHRTRSSDTRS